MFGAYPAPSFGVWCAQYIVVRVRGGWGFLKSDCKRCYKFQARWKGRATMCTDLQVLWELGRQKRTISKHGTSIGATI